MSRLLNQTNSFYRVRWVPSWRRVAARLAWQGWATCGVLIAVAVAMPRGQVAFRAEVDTVPVYATVHSRDGQPVPRLR